MAPLSNRALLIRLLEPGARLHPLEWIPYFGGALWLFALNYTAGAWGQAIVELATTNALLQLGLFCVVVQIPCLLTGKMSSVDIGWPWGLVLLAFLVLKHHFQYCAEHDSCGLDNRSLWVGVALLVHGGRMGVGALVYFFPYTWPHGDLPRYQYAKQRWIETTHRANVWWLKQQQETLSQAYANSVLIAVPVLLVGTNPGPLRVLEVVGLASWWVFWVLENVSDGQKLKFQRRWKKTKSTSSDSKTAVLGWSPYDGWEYCLWTWCRHPNYFCEWMCWNSLIVMAIPSAMELNRAIQKQATNHHNPNSAAVLFLLHCGIWVLLVCLSRVFYDCLLYWTGAEAAESRSVARRPMYKEYQKHTNVFFPVSIPGFDHHRVPGWPVQDTRKQQ